MSKFKNWAMFLGFKVYLLKTLHESVRVSVCLCVSLCECLDF